MAARNFEAKNIIVGAAVVYAGKAGEENSKINVSAADKSAQNPTNVTSVAGGNWYHLGYTMDGVTLNIEPTYNDVMVDQLLDTARLFKTSQRVTVATSLTEATLENLYVAIGGKAGSEGDYQSNILSNDMNLTASADGSVAVAATASSAILAGGAATASSQVQNLLHINGGALGVAPVERSVCFVGSAPTSVADTAPNKKAERIYMLYRAVSVDAVGVGVKRDDSTSFPVSFRVMPSVLNPAPDTNAAYGKIIDRIF